MLFYADRVDAVDALEIRDRVAEALAGAATAHRHDLSPHRSPALEAHGDLVGAAIALGELHQALSDHLNPSVDDAFPEVDRVAAAGILVGRCLYRSARLLGLCPEPSRQGTTAPDSVGKSPPGAGSRGAGQTDKLTGVIPWATLPELLEEAARAVAQAISPPLPAELRVRAPEGYAFYCVYPEMYLASATRALASEPQRCCYAVLGIRSIGTSLATMIAGALVEMGLQVGVETLRPRGHPFDRYVELAPALRERLEAYGRSGAGFFIVDEGPGLTCSSFLSVCAALSALGVEEERLSILSAWQGAPSVYASDEARARWKRLRVFHTGAVEAFDGWRAFVPFVRQALAARSKATSSGVVDPLPEIHDLSYGRWREHCLPSPQQWPAIHRAAERTKVLYRFHGGVECGARSGDREWPPPGGDGRDAGPAEQPALDTQPSSALLAKFVGLGDYGRRKHERAIVLAAAGFSPPVLGLAYGFLLHPFICDGRPMVAADLSPALLARMVEYYAFVAHRFSAPPSPRFDQLTEMVLANSREALGLDASGFVGRWRCRRDAINRLSLALLDGRPQPHEWLKVETGAEPTFVKTDSSDHFRDHTLVGEQSILWDLAGVCEEWEMDEAGVGQLLELWERDTGDRQAADLLSFYRTAYLAFRVAALHYAVHSTDEEDIRRSLQHQEWRYRHRLRCMLESAPLPGPLPGCEGEDGVCRDVLRAEMGTRTTAGG